MTKTDDAREGRREEENKKDAPQGEPQVAELRAVVDRVEEGGVAVLSLEGHEATLDVPLARLPEGASDGDHLRLTFDGEPTARSLTGASLDREARASAQDRVRRMQERLEKLSGTEGKKDFKL